MGITMLMRIEELSSGYGGMPVFRGVNLEIQPGDSIGILGDNGTGKSTLLSTLASIIEPLAGSITVRDASTVRSGRKTAQHQATLLVPQTNRNIPTLSVRENLLLAGWRIGRKRDRMSRVNQVLCEPPFDQLKPKQHLDASMLSGGQQLLLSLAAATMCDAQLIMLDEPTSGADERNIHEIVRYLLEYRAQGKTLILVEQIPWVAYAVSNRICMMISDNGSCSTLVELNEHEIASQKAQTASPRRRS
jgi:branched-chain amino acid transport system ATP-binding protein